MVSDGDDGCGSVVLTHWAPRVAHPAAVLVEGRRWAPSNAALHGKPWRSSAVVALHDGRRLLTGSGSVYILRGPPHERRLQHAARASAARFADGFPRDWQALLLGFERTHEKIDRIGATATRLLEPVPGPPLPPLKPQSLEKALTQQRAAERPTVTAAASPLRPKLGRVGTAKYKANVRKMVREIQDGRRDDAFDSTPMRQARARLQLTDVEEEDDQVEEEEETDGQPGEFAAAAVGAAAAPSRRASQKEVPCSPGLLRIANRQNADKYVAALRRTHLRAGQPGAALSSSPCRPAARRAARAQFLAEAAAALGRPSDEDSIQDDDGSSDEDGDL